MQANGNHSNGQNLFKNGHNGSAIKKNNENLNNAYEECDDLLKEKEAKKLNNIKHNQKKLISNNSQKDNSNADSSFHYQLDFDVHFFIKLIIALGGLITIFVNTIYGFLFPHGDVPCMEDLLFENTKEINSFFASNSQYRNILLITSSFCLDLSLIYILTLWVSYGKSYRFLVSLSLFYALRSSVQVIYIFYSINLNFFICF